MNTTRVGRRGQLTLPRQVRHQANIKEGDRVAFLVEGKRIIIEPLTQTLLDLRGSVPVRGRQDFNRIRRQVMAERAERAAQHEK